MYRSVLAVSLSLLLSTPLAAFGQASSPSPSTASIAPETQDGYKSPGIATLISVVVPGGGQMYAGKIGKGLVLLGISAGAVITGEALAVTTIGSCNVDANGNVSSSCGSINRTLAPLYIGTGVALGAWIYSMVTAGGDARAYNAKLGQRAELPVQPLIQRTATGATNFGLRVALGH
jgi:TM2 domain-containing membrane protein YozV